MANISPISLVKGLPDALAEETFETLLSRPGIHLERILSLGQISPHGTWYDQATDEWVLLLRGRARLTIEGQPDPVAMEAGDTLWLPAHCRHRVEWTDPSQICIWLALHLAAEP